MVFFGNFHEIHLSRSSNGVRSSYLDTNTMKHNTNVGYNCFLCVFIFSALSIVQKLANLIWPDQPNLKIGENQWICSIWRRFWCISGLDEHSTKLPRAQLSTKNRFWVSIQYFRSFLCIHTCLGIINTSTKNHENQYLFFRKNQSKRWAILL